VADAYTGGAWFQDRLYTWGTELREWDLPLRVRRAQPGPPIRFGCVYRNRLVLESNSELRWGKSLIDTGTRVIDACETNLFQRNGLLVINRGMQVRFYEFSGAGERWPYREIYSFYTASEQGGLYVHDVDRDGRPDIFCGNYWIQAPAEFALPWRLFAINLINDTPLAASARLAWVNGRLLWLESKSPRARMFWLTAPADPRQLWRQEAVGIAPLAYPRAVLTRGEKVWIGHAAGVTEVPGGRLIAQCRAVQQLVETPAGVVGVLREDVIWLGD